MRRQPQRGEDRATFRDFTIISSKISRTRKFIEEGKTGVKLSHICITKVEKLAYSVINPQKELPNFSVLETKSIKEEFKRLNRKEEV